MNYYPPWGQWAPPPVQPMMYCPPTSGPPQNNNPTPQFTSWQDVHRHAKQEMKREAKMKRKWEEDAKKKKDMEKKPNPPKPAIPLVEGLIFMVLLSPLIGLPTLKLYQTLFHMWGVALGAN